MEKPNLAPRIGVKAKVKEGKFSNEYIASVELIDGTFATLFADKYLFKKIDSDWYLKVTQMADPKDGKQLVLLTSESLTTGTRWAEVDIDSVNYEIFKD